MTEGVGARLAAVHRGGVAETLPERIEAASCGPAVKHLAHLAMRAAEAGGTPDQWRAWVAAHVPEVSPTLLVEAEDCMHDVGLWPWN
jgi:hypothetical protein